MAGILGIYGDAKKFSMNNANGLGGAIFQFGGP